MGGTSSYFKDAGKKGGGFFYLFRKRGRLVGRVALIKLLCGFRVGV